MSTNRNKGRGGGQRPFTKTVKVPQAVKLDKNSGVTTVGNKLLPEAFVVVVSVPGIITRQLTFHHPIGFTNLARDAWVCTPSSDVQDLLNRAEHPQFTEVQSKRRAHMRASAISNGLLTVKEVDGVHHYCYPGGDDRNESLNAARAELKAKKATDPEGVKGLTANSFLTAQNRAAEMALHDYYSSYEVRKAAEDNVPLPSYETCSGALANQRQVKLALDANHALDAVDTLVARIAATKVEESALVPVKTGAISSSIFRGRSKSRKRDTNRSSSQPK